MITLDISSSIELEYFAEGAANIVYKITACPSTPSTAADSDFYDYDLAVTELAPLQIDPGLEGKLVRLRKATAANTSVLESYKNYEDTIVPLFPRIEDRVEYVLFKPTTTLLSEMNRQLNVMENKQLRLKKRCGIYLAEDEEYGLLVTDMSCSSPSSGDFRCFEFKPKWLVQSPSAPIDATRCRTCALRNFRRAQSPDSLSLSNRSSFCPLGLVSHDRRVVERTVSNIFEWTSQDTEITFLDLTLRQKLVDVIFKNPLLDLLRELQSHLDPHGALTSFSNPRFLTAMTLRDCTVFIKVS